MNYPARVFRDLSTTWQHEVTSSRIDVLAAELASCLADTESVCLGLMLKEAIPKLYGLIFFLDSYGLVLRQCYREQNDAAFIFLDRKKDCSSEYAGAYVIEHVNELAQAA